MCYVMICLNYSKVRLSRTLHKLINSEYIVFFRMKLQEMDSLKSKTKTLDLTASSIDSPN